MLERRLHKSKDEIINSIDASIITDNNRVTASGCALREHRAGAAAELKKVPLARRRAG
jgi:hypothetical protein